MLHDNLLSDGIILLFVFCKLVLQLKGEKSGKNLFFCIRPYLSCLYGHIPCDIFA